MPPHDLLLRVGGAELERLVAFARLRAQPDLPRCVGRGPALRRIADERGVSGLAFSTDLSTRELRALIEAEPQ
jgi:hypothetical protein